MESIRLGVIGYGGRIHNFLKSVQEFELGAAVTAVADPDEAGVRARMGGAASACRFYTGADAMLADGRLDAVLVGTRCSLHAEMACKVLERGLPLFLEKPVATSLEDLARLRGAFERYGSATVVSFPLRFAPVVQTVKELLDRGTIGRVQHVLAVNHVPYGDVYFQSWYRDAHETGGLFLQKATHDFDYLRDLLGVRMLRVSAMTSRTHYVGGKPYDLRCEDCAERESCPQSDFVKRHFSLDTVQGPYCAFSEGVANEDSASALLLCESGLHIAYDQCFFAKKAARRRGAKLIGERGTLEFDFYTDEITVSMHEEEHTQTHRLGYSGELHFGGDRRLAYHFLNVVRGKERSRSTLSDGIESALICLRARESAQTGRTLDITF